VLSRSALRGTVAAGLPRWLRGVQVEATFDKRRFRGWTVVSLFPGDPCSGGIEIRPGDIVTRVNGKSVERPEQALEIFQGVATGNVLTVDLVHDGRPRTIRFQIEGDEAAGLGTGLALTPGGRLAVNGRLFFGRFALLHGGVRGRIFLFGHFGFGRS
jgi:hypothetical protein